MCIRDSSITIKSDYHKNQEAFQKTQYFKERFKTRYMIAVSYTHLDVYKRQASTR